MRRMVRAAAIAGVLVLTLASCDVLFMGIFSSNTAQATSRIDLSSSIAAANAASFTLAVLKSGENEYVLLFSSLGFDRTRPHLIVLSPDLQLQNSYTQDDIIARPPNGDPLMGSAAMTHLPDGHIVIGNLQTIASGAGLALDKKLSPAMDGLNGWSIEGPPNSRTWSNFQLDFGTQVLSYIEYDAAMSAATPRSHSVSSGTTRYNLEGVFTNPEDALNNSALVVFSESNTQNSVLHFIPVSKNPDFSSEFPGPPIIENTAYTGTGFTKANLEQGSIFTTWDSIIGYDSRSRSLIRFTPQDPSTENRLSMPSMPKDLKFAFSFSGSYYCTWDPATRVVTRYEKWW
jgi:hypothetical protein